MATLNCEEGTRAKIFRGERVKVDAHLSCRRNGNCQRWVTDRHSVPLHSGNRSSTFVAFCRCDMRHHGSKILLDEKGQNGKLKYLIQWFGNCTQANLNQLKDRPDDAVINLGIPHNCSSSTIVKTNSKRGPISGRQNRRRAKMAGSFPPCVRPRRGKGNMQEVRAHAAEAAPFIYALKKESK